MEKLKFLLIIPFLMLSHSPAQVAADYYLPLQLGNALTYRSTGWEPRTVYESIEGADSINGQLYFVQVGKEVIDNAPLDTQIFHSFWLREAPSGDIMIIAVGLGESTLLDSAMVYETPYPFFSNEHLISGSHWGYLYEGTYYQDSIMSVTKTVNTLAGTFTNCIKMRRIRIDSLGETIWLHYVYYAENVGEVMKIRITPDPHTNTLSHINFQTSVNRDSPEVFPEDFALWQNYPNPFNPSTTISYQLPESAIVNLSIYNITGQRIETLVNEHKDVGQYSVKWNAKDMPSGIYFFRIQAGDFMSVKKCVLMK